MIKFKSSIKNVSKGINNIRYIIIKYLINKVLSPSIKFPPLIKTIKQNVTNTLFKYVFDNKVSTNSIFVVLISIFKICENVEKPKVAHRNILAQQDLVNQNYSIMQLYDPSISVLNRSSIDYNIANFEGDCKHINFKKMLFEDGQGSINFTDLWNILKKIKR